MKKGVNAWSLPNDLSLEETFKLAKDAGFDTIELNMSEKVDTDVITDELGLEDNLILSLDTSSAELEEIKKTSERYELPISSISTALHWTYPLNHADEAIREKGKLVIRKMIDAAAFLGGDCVLIVPGLVTAEHDYATCYDLSKQAFLDVADYAQEKGIVIGVENVWNKFLLSPLEMKQFIDEINHPFVKVYFDAGNILQFGFPEQWVKILGDRIAKVHIKDFNTSIGNITGFTTLLNGNLNWPKLMDSLKEIGYDGEITCEIPPYNTNPSQLAYDTSAAMSYILAL